MTTSVAIVGAGGGVGSSTAFNLLVRDEPYDVLMVDGRSGMAVSHEMDLQQVVASGSRSRVAIVALDAIADADFVVVTAAVPLTVNRSRAVYLRENAAVLESIVGTLPSAWPGTIVVVTNPVDALVTHLHRRFGLDRTRLVGYTANDTLRLRTAVAGELGVAPADVDAWVLGEHGDHCVPLLDRITVAGAPAELDAAQRAAVADFVRTWYVRHVALDSGRSSTWTSGLGVARMVAALAGKEPSPPWPASVVLDGEYGVEGVALTVPVSLGRSGVEAVHDWELPDGDARAMRAAAAVVSAAADRL